jgi:hypothetical protein
MVFLAPEATAQALRDFTLINWAELNCASPDAPGGKWRASAAKSAIARIEANRQD